MLLVHFPEVMLNNFHHSIFIIHFVLIRVISHKIYYLSLIQFLKFIENSPNELFSKVRGSNKTLVSFNVNRCRLISW